ncbi:MAG TPA: 2Fe-2S iron-sulfur cluster-binding protein [Spirochaetota bacterium]|nr:2Fe-2S iron-sulfur cluster-binding protein [Spirochaetota bacterium]
MADIKFSIDGKECTGKPGQSIVDAAKDNGIYIPVLCNYQGMKPAGTCRICTVRVGGRFMAACTTPIGEGMIVESGTPDIEDMRKAIVEMLFVEGNHMCPCCEKSGNCELQALGYRYQMLVPRFPYLWPASQVDASTPKIFLDKNRCVQCLRCVRGAVTPDGKHVFGLLNRGDRTAIAIDHALASKMTDEMAQKAMDSCPVGAILRKEVGYVVPIGMRKFDSKPIGSDIGQ